MKINRFAEHFIEDCLNCPESVKDECLKKCKSKRMKSFKKVREAEEIKNQQLQAAEYAERYYPVIGSRRQIASSSSRTTSSMGYCKMTSAPFGLKVVAIIKNALPKEMVNLVSLVFKVGSNLLAPAN